MKDGRRWWYKEHKTALNPVIVVVTRFTHHSRKCNPWARQSRPYGGFWRRPPAWRGIARSRVCSCLFERSAPLAPVSAIFQISYGCLRGVQNKECRY